MRAALKLSRAKDQRRALVKGLATSLVMSENITTTKPKAKVLVPYFEHLVVIAKKGDLASKRRVRTQVTTDEAAAKLVNDLAKRFSSRSGGFVRLAPAGHRVGDDAELATISLTEAPAPAKTETSTTTKTVAKKPVAKAKATTKAKS